jgi:hypothetical protein
MVSLGFSPSWFFQQSIFFELAFAVITLVVALYSFKIYKLSKEKSIMLFGAAFLLFSFSYFVQSALNVGILYELSKNVDVLQKASQVVNLGLNALYTHMIFMIAGLTLITFITLKTKSPRIFLLLLSMSLLPIYLSKDPIHTFFVISSTYLIFITYSYLKNYVENKKKSTLLVFLAFLLLFLSDIHFIFAINHHIFYVIGHFLELVAYIFILVNLAWCLRNG